MTHRAHSERYHRLRSFMRRGRDRLPAHAARPSNGTYASVAKPHHGRRAENGTKRTARVRALPGNGNDQRRAVREISVKYRHAFVHVKLRPQLDRIRSRDPVDGGAVDAARAAVFQSCTRRDRTPAATGGWGCATASRILTADITGFSKYRLAKAFLRWLGTNGWEDLTAA